MPVIRHPAQFPQWHGPGWSGQGWAGAEVFGETAGMEARRYRIDPGAPGPVIPLGAHEALAYVIAGSGSAQPAAAASDSDGPRADEDAAAGGRERFALGRESLLWLGGCEGIRLRAGGDGLDVLVAEPAAPDADGDPVAVACKVFAASELPHLVSTRDTRDRLDLVTENVPVGARRVRADRILYHPGDTAAAHYHTDSSHVFCVLAGSGLLYSGEHAFRLEAGMSALVRPGEEHWFEDDRAEEFSFVEFWAPPPSGTVWTVEGDRCTWAASPAGE